MCVRLWLDIDLGWADGIHCLSVRLRVVQSICKKERPVYRAACKDGYRPQTYRTTPQKLAINS